MKKQGENKINAINPKVAKADELRRVALRAGEKATKIAKKSSAEMAAAKTQAEKTAVRTKYSQKRKMAKLEAGQAFLNYDNYLQETFGIQAKFAKHKKK